MATALLAAKVHLTCWAVDKADSFMGYRPKTWNSNKIPLNFLSLFSCILTSPVSLYSSDSLPGHRASLAHAEG